MSHSCIQQCPYGFFALFEYLVVGIRWGGGKQLYIYISYVLTLLGYILLDIDICIFELFCIFVFIAEHLRLFLFCQFEKLVVEFNDMSF